MSALILTGCSVHPRIAFDNSNYVHFWNSFIWHMRGINMVDEKFKFFIYLRDSGGED